MSSLDQALYSDIEQIKNIYENDQWSAVSRSRDSLLAGLRARIRRIERGEAAAHAVLPLGVAAIDAALPGGGLARGAVHEVAGSAAGGVAAMVAGRLGGGVLWCVAAASRSVLHGPGLAAFGLDTDALVIVRCASWRDMLWAMEEGLREPALAAVIGEPDRAVSLTASRRLQLAAEASGVTGLILRQGGETGVLAPSAVFSRWRAESAPMADSADPPSHAARWTLELMRCRGGFAGAGRRWTVEWRDAADNLALVPEPADRPAAPAGECRRVG
jgi:protein ImuA